MHIFSPTEQEIIHKLTGAIIHKIPTWFDQQARFIHQAPTAIRYQNSFAFLYTLTLADQSSITLRVKIHRLEGNNSLASAIADPNLKIVGRKEFNFLKIIARGIQEQNDPQLGFIRPIAYLPRWNAIIMIELDAISFREIVFHPKMRLGDKHYRHRFEKAIYATGKWLRVYHQHLGKIEKKTFNADELGQKNAQRFKQIMQMGISNPSIEALRKKFIQVLKIINHRPATYAHQHGDFHFSNILLSPDDKVIIIDMDPRYQERLPIYADISALLTDIKVQKMLLKSLGFLMSESYLQKSQQLLLDGYFVDAPPDEIFLALYSATGMLRAIHWYRERALEMSGAKKLLSTSAYPFMQRYFCRKAHTYLDHILKTT